jgi:subtilase family serine protease
MVSSASPAVRRLPFSTVITVLAALVIMFTSGHARAQTSPQPLVALRGNHPAEATSMHPVAHADSFAQLNMEVTLALRNRAALDQLLRDQQDPASPRYHQWLTAEQFKARFGPSRQDPDAVAQWVSSQGFPVTATNLDERYVRFTGKVSDAERVFATDIMAFGDGTSYSNTTDPSIPARLAGVVSAIRGLNNFLHWQAEAPGGVAPPDPAPPSSPLVLLDQAQSEPMPPPSTTTSSPEAVIGHYRSFAPSDFYSFYDEGSMFGGRYQWRWRRLHRNRRRFLIFVQRANRVQQCV